MLTRALALGCLAFQMLLFSLCFFCWRRTCSCSLRFLPADLLLLGGSSLTL